MQIIKLLISLLFLLASSFLTKDSIIDIQRNLKFGEKINSVDISTRTSLLYHEIYCLTLNKIKTLNIIWLIKQEILTSIQQS